MPLYPSNSNPIANQVLPDGTKPYVNQMDVAQMIGQVQAWNPDLSAPKILAELNNSARKIYDRKTWFGCFIRGQVVAPKAVTYGQATVTSGSAQVTGTNTTWSADMIGRQFRTGYNNPIYTIADVDEAQQVLKLDLPWGSMSGKSGYFIAQNYYKLGPNIKYLKNMLNTQMGIQIAVGANQDTLNAMDPWRQNQNFPYLAATLPVAADGSFQVELYPSPWVPQAFPFLAYIQPPNLVDDKDNLPPYIRGDVVVKDAIANALVIGGPRNNKYYDAAESQRKRAEFESELVRMANSDENLYRTEITKFGEGMPYFQTGGALWSAQHAVSAGSGGYDL